jgi:hypothetical protein
MIVWLLVRHFAHRLSLINITILKHTTESGDCAAERDQSSPRMLVISRVMRFNMVGKDGFEPTQPKVTDLQSAATLQLRRLPTYQFLKITKYNSTTKAN